VRLVGVVIEAFEDFSPITRKLEEIST